MKTWNVIYVGSQREMVIGTVKARTAEDAGWTAHNKYNRGGKYDENAIRVEIKN